MVTGHPDDRGSRFRSRLDLLATVAMILVSASILWVMFVGGPQAVARAGAPTSAQKPQLRVPSEALPVGGAASVGSERASVVMIEYSDFQCPYCGKFAREILPGIVRAYVDSGRVRIVFKHLPLTRLHPFAQKAAEAAECANREGKFWDAHNLLFSDQKHLDETAVNGVGKTLGLSAKPFATCMNGEMTASVEADAAEATKLGIRSTPAFLVGRVLSSGLVQVSEVISGAKPPAEFYQVLDRVLAGSRP